VLSKLPTGSQPRGVMLKSAISDLYLTGQVQHCILQFLEAWHPEVTVCIYALHTKGK